MVSPQISFHLWSHLLGIRYVDYNLVIEQYIVINFSNLKLSHTNWYIFKTDTVLNWGLRSLYLLARAALWFKLGTFLFLTVFGTGSLRWRYQQAWFLWKKFWSSLLCWAAVVCWQSLTSLGLHTHHSDLCLHHHMTFYLCACVWVQVFRLYKHTTHTGLRV